MGAARLPEELVSGFSSPSFLSAVLLASFSVMGYPSFRLLVGIGVS